MSITNEAEPHRARYHSSAMNVEYLNVGQDFDELPNTYIIFITEEDFYKRDSSIYPIERMNMVTGKSFHDGEYIFYVNGKYRGEDDIGKLIYDFNCKDPVDMNYKILEDWAKYLKENPEGVRAMCKAIDDLRIESECGGEKGTHKIFWP